MRFRYSIYGHAVHSWEQVVREWGGEAILGELYISLSSQELRLLHICGCWLGFVDRDWVPWLRCLCPRPEPFTESITNRFDKGLIGMSRKVGLKDINTDWGDNFEKVWILSQSLSDSFIIQG